METRSYLCRRLAFLVSSLDQVHKEINVINGLLHEQDKQLAPQPLGGLTSGQSSIRLPNLPTPLREVANAMDEIERRGTAETPTAGEGEPRRSNSSAPPRRSRNTSGSYFPHDGMSSSHTIPIMHDDLGVRKRTALANSKSEADLRGNRPPMPTHPALRQPAVESQGRYPKFKKLMNYKDR
jgi:hypothetical protein